MRYIFALIAVVAVLFASVSYAANEADRSEVRAARTVVANYKELRRVCTVARGDERRACFRQLNDSNQAYQQAKQVLRSLDTEDGSNLHVVSNAY